MKNAILLLVMTGLFGHAMAQNEDDPTGMGMERVARLFTEVYKSPKAESDQATRWVQVDLGEPKIIDAVCLYPKVRAYGIAVSEGCAH